MAEMQGEATALDYRNKCSLDFDQAIESRDEWWTPPELTSQKSIYLGRQVEKNQESSKPVRCCSYELCALSKERNKFVYFAKYILES